MAPRALPGWPLLNILRFGVQLLLALILFTLRARFRTAMVWRKLGFAYALVLVSVLSIGAYVSGCGGGGGGGGSQHNPGTPAGTYTMTVSGASGGVSHTQKLNLTVK